MKRMVLLLMAVLMFISCGVAVAGELVAKEAINYYNQGVEAQKKANFAEADINYQKTIILDPNNPKWQKLILNNRGVMYAQLGQTEQAEAAFKAALDIDPKYKPALSNLSYIYEIRMNRCEYLEHMAKLNDWDKLKPKSLVMSEAEEKK